MNFFRRPAPPKIKEPATDPPPASARQEKERNWLSTVSRRREVSAGDREPSRRREHSEKSSEGGDRGGKSKGVGNGWLGTHSTEGEPQSSQASVRSKKSFFRSKGVQRSETLRSNPSTSSSPASTTTPVFSPSFSPTLTASTEHEPSSSTSTATVTLASRLQELAVANADGLLNESEYRILRQQLFANHTKGDGGKKQVEINTVKLSEGSLAVPRLNGAPRSAPASTTSFNADTVTKSPTSPPRTRLTAPSSASSRAPSIVSTQSKRHSILPSLFRREPSSTLRLEEDWDVVTPPLASPLDNELSTPPLASDNHNTFSDRSSRTALSPPTSPIRTRSIRNHPGLASSAMDSRSSSYFAGSSRSSNGRSFGGGAESVFSDSKSNGNAPRSPTSLRTRHYNGGGGTSMYSHGFSSNHSHDRGSGVETLLSHSLPPITSSTDPLLFAATDREPTVKELEQEIKEIEGEWKRMRESWKDIVQQRVDAWEKQVGGNVAAKAREAAALEFHEAGRVTTVNGGGGQTSKVGHEKKGAFKRASFLPSRSTTPPTIVATASLPSFLLSPSRPIPPDFIANLPPHLLEPTRTLQTSIGEILDRQQRTEEKYERRLEFLRAKERGARIKQGLLK